MKGFLCHPAQHPAAGRTVLAARSQGIQISHPNSATGCPLTAAGHQLSGICFSCSSSHPRGKFKSNLPPPPRFPWVSLGLLITGSSSNPRLGCLAGPGRKAFPASSNHLPWNAPPPVPLLHPKKPSPEPSHSQPLHSHFPGSQT